MWIRYGRRICVVVCVCVVLFFCQAEDGIRDLVRSRGLGDVYKRQGCRSDEDRKDALDIALKLKIPFEVLDYRKEYQDKVLSLSLIHI